MREKQVVLRSLPLNIVVAASFCKNQACTANKMGHPSQIRSQGTAKTST